MDTYTEGLYEYNYFDEIENYADQLAEKLYALLEDETARNGAAEPYVKAVNDLREGLNRSLGRAFQFLAWGGDRYGKEADKCPLAHLPDVYKDQEEAFRFFHILEHGGRVLIRDPYTKKTSHYVVDRGFYSQAGQMGGLEITSPNGGSKTVMVPQCSAVWLLPKGKEFLFIGEFFPADISENPNEEDMCALEDYLHPSSPAEIFLAKDKNSGDTKICTFRGIDRKNKAVIADEVGTKGQNQILPIKTYKFGFLDAA